MLKEYVRIIDGQIIQWKLLPEKEFLELVELQRRLIEECEWKVPGEWRLATQEERRLSK